MTIAGLNDVEIGIISAEHRVVAEAPQKHIRMHGPGHHVIARGAGSHCRHDLRYFKDFAVGELDLLDALVAA